MKKHLLFLFCLKKLRKERRAMPKKDIRIAYYEKTDEQKKRTLYYRKRQILKGDNELLKNMVRIVDQNVVKYHSDFYIHDVEIIKEIKGNPLLWIVRDFGTHMLNLYSEDFSEHNEWSNNLFFNAILHNSGDRIKGIYLIENNRVQKITKEKAFSVLNQYEELIRRKVKVRYA